MLHLRVYSPPDMTDDVVTILAKHGTSQWGVLRGVGAAPARDLVVAEIVRESANAVISGLYERGVHREGAIQIEPVETWVSRLELEAEERAPGAGADAVVWAQVTHRAYEDSALSWTYVSFMIMATVIASIGIVVDSQILIIGAMVLGPEFGAVAALGLALLRRRRTLFRQALRTLLLGFAAAIVVTALASLLGRALGWITYEQVTGPRPFTGFVYTPDRWSIVVALIAGAAGVLALTSARSGGLTGVFISVTTVPAAGNVALGLAFQAWNEVAGSTMQLLVNITGMALSGWLTLVLQRLVWSRVVPGSVPYARGPGGPVR